MLNIKKEINNLKEKTGEVLEQCGTVNKFLRKTISRLDMQKGNLKRKGHYEKARRNFHYANRSGVKAGRAYKKVKESLEKLKPFLSPDDKRRVENYERELGPHESVITKETSFFTGKLGDDIDAVGVQLDLFKKKKVDAENVGGLIDNTTERIKKVIADPQMGISGRCGLLPFMAVVRKLYDFAEGFEKEEIKRAA